MNTRYHPAPPAPLSSMDSYTSWPGGVDPTVSLFRTDTQKGGKTRRWCRKNRKNTRKAQKARKSRKGCGRK